MKRLAAASLRRWRRLALPPLAGLALFLAADQLWPLPQAALRPHYATVVVAADGTPLRTFPGEDETWRYPVAPERVSPLFIQALLAYEDRWFYHHPGFNPLALARAAWQNLRHGRVISGGSTLTMQVARLIAPHSRDLAGKLRQVLRALQLEWHYSKEEILTLYLNHAPYGGMLTGVEAASRTYFGKPAHHLTHAEAALLAVLPQAPSRLRPDRHPQQAREARDKVLQRLGEFGIWDAQTLAEARQEPVTSWYQPTELLAPLLARRLRRENPGTDLVRTGIDIDLQRRLEQDLRQMTAALPPHASAAVLVVENDTLLVRAYAGSGDFLNEERPGHVDMVTATRSPGSTLKPFLYAIALDDGLVHSESLLVDAPLSFDGYRPANFSGGFSGAVGVADALRRSLNVPAVDLLDRIGPSNFDARLRNGGLDLTYPPGAVPNLAMILGGVGARLEDLVGAYRALAHGGLGGPVRYHEAQPLRERRMMSPGAAWIVREILRDGHRPGLAGGAGLVAPNRGVAWKTGTSYGFRDAWALGVTERYTLGVWVGRPDGTPLPGHYGAATAAPLLFAVVELLPRGPALEGGYGQRPDNVSQVAVCWPLGGRATPEEEALCHHRRSAWVLNDTVPLTLPDRLGRLTQTGLVSYRINPATGRRVVMGCATQRSEVRRLARWPLALQSWLPPPWRERSRLPPLDRACRSDGLAAPLRLLGHEGILHLRKAGALGQAPHVSFDAVGGEAPLYWLVDGEVKRQTATPGRFHHRFTENGSHQLTVIDGRGNYDSLRVELDPL